MWQDYLIMFSNILISYALIPQVLKNFKEKRRNISLVTGFITFLALFLMAFSFFMLNLVFSTIITSFNCLLWLILFIQAIKYK